MQRHRLACTGRAADPPVAAGVLIIIVGIEKYRGAVIEVQSQKDPIVVTQLIGNERKGCCHAGGQRIAACLTLNIRIKRQNGKSREKRLLVFIVAAPCDHIHGYAQLLHLCDALFQRFGIRCRHFNQGMHIIEILALPVHYILEIKAGTDRTIQFLVVLPRIAHIPHPGAVDHSGLGDFGEDLFLGLTLDEKTQVNPFASLHQRRKPAGANRGGVTVARDIEISMIHVVYDDVVTAFCIHRGGRENVENGGGAGFKLTEIRLFFAKEHPLQKRLFFDLIFRRLFFLFGLLWNCFCSFFRFFLYLHRLTPHKCRERPLSYRKRPPADAHAGWFSCSKSHRAA